MSRPGSLFLVLSLIGLANPGPAHAAANDFTLWRFGKLDPRGICPSDPAREDCVVQVRPNNTLFQKFAKDFGQVMSPKFLAPAETLGQAGFDFGIESSFSLIDNQAEHWLTAAPDAGEAPNSTIATMQLHVRKGLPFSFELGGSLTKLMQSDMWALGAELKWAFNEGFYYLPDVAVRVSANRLLGSNDIDLLTGGLDVSISHPFGIGGLLSITPYAGYNMLFVNASSHVMDATPGFPGATPSYCVVSSDANLDGADRRYPIAGGYGKTAECEKAAYAAHTEDYRANFVLSRQKWNDPAMRIHRGFLGFRIKVTIVSIVAEAALAEEVQTYSARLGMDF